MRLFVRPAVAVDLSGLEEALQKSLGGYFAPPIWSTTATGEEGRLAERMFELAEPLGPLAYEDPLTGVAQTALAARWWKLERRLSKQSWLLPGRVQPPWPLQQGRPAIVAFYSFKGGVGRTTALASVAWQLARQGRRSVVIDLDLEAPGAGPLLELPVDRGVLDFIIDYLSTGATDLTGLVSPAQALGADAERVDVLPAGLLDLDYLEKLGRLDFVARDLAPELGASQVERALRVLLERIANEIRPDFILIDSRAGLHDLAGLSLHGLAHVDVLFGRASEQSHAGLDLTLRMLAQRKGDELLSVVVHTMAPADPQSPEARREEAEFRERSYRIFCRYVYAGDVPFVDAEGAAHSPQVLRFDPRLLQFHSLGGMQEALFAQGYQRLAARITDLCQPPEEAE